MKPRYRCAHRAFTLIELLVVIAIIALLIAVLLPVLGAGRERARAVKCSAQLSQMNVALEMYVTDFGEAFPYVFSFPLDATPPGAIEAFTEPMGPYYAQADEVLLCPTQPEAVETQGLADAFGFPLADGSPEYIGYQANYWVLRNAVTGLNVEPCRRRRITQPSQTIWTFDGDVGMSIGGPWEMLMARHGGPTANVAALDGHVEAIPATSDGTTPGLAALDGGPELVRYRVAEEDRGDWPIYHAGTSQSPRPYLPRDENWIHASLTNFGQAVPGFGAIVFGPPRSN